MRKYSSGLYVGLYVLFCVAVATRWGQPWSTGALTQNYTLTRLGALPGFATSWANGINNAGQVVGYSETSLNTLTQATIWNGASPTALDTLPEYSSSIAYGINASAQVVGYSAIRGAVPADAQPTIWNGTTPANLGTLGGTFGIAVAINDAGIILGGTFPGGSTNLIATIWQGSSAIALATPSGGSSAAGGINSAGQIVGSITNQAGTNTHATLWSGNTITTLGTFGGPYNAAGRINNAGQIVGEMSTTAADTARHAVLWIGITPTDLGTIPGGTVSYAEGINNAGQIVGYSDTGYLDAKRNKIEHATLWENGQIIDLNSAIGPTPARGVTLNFARDINDSGWIIVNTCNSETCEAYLLTPVPDALAALLKEVTSVGSGTSLADKVKSAQAYLAFPDTQATCAMLTGFVKEVQAQDGKKIAQKLGAQLIANADAIEAAIDCK